MGCTDERFANGWGGEGEEILSFDMGLRLFDPSPDEGNFRGLAFNELFAGNTGKAGSTVPCTLCPTFRDGVEVAFRNCLRRDSKGGTLLIR